MGYPSLSLVPRPAPLHSDQSQLFVMPNRTGKSWRLVAGKDKKGRQRRCNGSSGDGLHEVAGRLTRRKGSLVVDRRVGKNDDDDDVSRDGDSGRVGGRDEPGGWVKKQA